LALEIVSDHSERTMPRLYARRARPSESELFPVSARLGAWYMGQKLLGAPGGCGRRGRVPTHAQLDQVTRGDGQWMLGEQCDDPKRIGQDQLRSIGLLHSTTQDAGL